MTAPGNDAWQVRMHRALSSRVRTRLLDLLRREPDLDAAGLAARLQLHVNTVRTHLGVLEEAGLVVSVVEERDRPGRPRLLYRAAAEGALESGQPGEHGYRFLAEVLAGSLGATVDDAAGPAEAAGAAWGRFVVDSPPPFAEVGADAAVERLMVLLEEFGFAPELDDAGPGEPTVLLRRCPFLEVARAHQEVVCSVHLGLMRGALDELGARAQVEDLIPWGAPGGCVSHLALPAG